MSELKCKNCGSKNLKMSDEVLLSLPPQYKYVCQDCGNVITSYDWYIEFDKDINNLIIKDGTDKLKEECKN